MKSLSVAFVSTAILLSLHSTSAAASTSMSLSRTAAAAEMSTTSVSSKPNLFSSSQTTTMMNNQLAFNFLGLSKGMANIYFDIGGVSEWVAPSISYRTYSNQEARKVVDGNKITVDRNLATVGASIMAYRSDNKALILNPYLFFGTEKDAIQTSTSNGIGARLMGQIQLNKTVALQVGVDGNSMESSNFKGDVYLGLGLAI